MNAIALRAAILSLVGLLIGSPIPSLVGDTEAGAAEVGAAEAGADFAAAAEFVQGYCVDCHASGETSGDFDLDMLDLDGRTFGGSDFDNASWERMLTRIASGQMPPPDADRPSESEYARATKRIAKLLDEHAAAHPNPGRTETLRRMTRIEYQNAVGDLTGVVIDAAELLPPDESSGGFDNITVGELSPMRISRYVTAAQRIARAAVGRPPGSAGAGGPIGVTVRVPADRTQENHVAGLPLGTRGGTQFDHTFAAGGLYEIELKLTRDRDEKVEGLSEPHSLDVLIDGRQMHRFTVKPPPGRKDYTHVDSHLRTRIQIPAGTHNVGVTFARKAASLDESKRQPFDARYNRHRHPRTTPALFQVSLVGPLDQPDSNDETSSGAESGAPPETRRRIFSDDADDARSIVGRLARRAYRRPVTEADLESPMWFFEQGQAEGGFDAGIEAALTSILVNPNFLFRIESDPQDTAPGEPYRISDLELASRLSFFLWSSLPDEELLSLAEAGQLSAPETASAQVRRMLADPRSRSLVTNFAAQWLYLRNLDSMTPDLRLFPDFDDNLRQAFRGETEHLFADVIAQNRSVLSLIDSDHTFLNERLARHYGIPHVVGSQFRRVDLPAESIRGGILRHGSILTVTSYATRTSPTIRGHWILENLLGTPPPPPPANVPNLKEKSTLAATTVRERLAMHRADPACASCHDLMDPVGFALENFDAVGRFRRFDGTLDIDSAGTLPDGSDIGGIDALEKGIMGRPQMFVGTLVRKLMTFGLGRGMTADDGPAVRRIVTAAGQDEYRFESIVQAIVASDPFTMRMRGP